MYIIHPAIIYLIDMLINLKYVLELFCVTDVILFIFMCVRYAYNMDQINDMSIFPSFHDEDKKNEYKDDCKVRIHIMKKCFIAFIVMMSLNVFIPGTQTAYKMLFASYLTVDNIQYAHDFVANDLDAAIDKITDSIIKIKR